MTMRIILVHFFSSSLSSNVALRLFLVIIMMYCHDDRIIHGDHLYRHDEDSNDL